jgi:cytochrome c-type biogenesis protein
MSGTSVADQAAGGAPAAKSLSPAASAAAAGGQGPAVATIPRTAAGGAAGPADAAPAPDPSGPPGGLAARARGRAVLGTLLFVLGFGAVFTVEGAAIGSLGLALRSHEKILTQILGGVIILLGLLFLGAFDRFTVTGRIFRPQFRPRAGLIGAPLLGATFGLGWLPCIGPTLTAVLSLSATTGTAGRGALLAFIYALGLGIPFLIVAVAVQRGVAIFGFARRHARLVTQIGGVLLIAVGLLEVTGAWSAAVTWLQVHWFPAYNAPL